MFNFAKNFHGLSINPVLGIERFKVVDERPRVLTGEEAQRILSNSKGMYRSVFIIAMYTGMRKGEIEHLNWEHVNLADRLIHIRPVGS